MWPPRGKPRSQKCAAAWQPATACWVLQPPAGVPLLPSKPVAVTSPLGYRRRRRRGLLHDLVDVPLQPVVGYQGVTHHLQAGAGGWSGMMPIQSRQDSLLVLQAVAGSLWLAVAPDDPGRPLAVAPDDPGTPLAVAPDDPGTPLAVALDDPSTPLAVAPDDPGRPLAVAPDDPGTPLAVAPDDPGRPLAVALDDPGTPLAVAPEDPGRPLAVAPPSPPPHHERHPPSHHKPSTPPSRHKPSNTPPLTTSPQTPPLSPQALKQLQPHCPPSPPPPHHESQAPRSCQHGSSS